MSFLPWGPWRPDVAGPNKGYCETAQGVVPQATSRGFGYGPFPALVTGTGAEALSGAPRGAIALQKTDGSWQVYAATAAKIEVLDSSYQWSDVETGRTVTSGDDVSFVHFGSSLYNTDTTSGLKAYNVQAPAGNNAVSGAPANVRSIFSASNIMFALDCDSNNRRMRSSARGEPTTWVGSGADGKTFEDGGALIAGRDLGNGRAIVCQDRCLRLITFGAGPALYSISKIADGIGLAAQRNLVTYDATAWGWDKEGPWQYDGAVTRIGAEKVTRWARDTIGAANFKDLQGVVDPSRFLVIWRIDSATCIAYNYLAKEWSVLPIACAALVRFATPGVTIDSLSGTIDSLTSIIDNPEWAGSAPVLGALDTSYKTAFFSGANMAALIESAHVTDDSEPLVRWAKPESDATASTLAIGRGTQLGGALAWQAAVTKRADGWTQQRARARVMAFRETIAAGAAWTFANGVEVGGGPQQ